MYTNVQKRLAAELQQIEESGLFKKERIITSPQGADITVDVPGKGTLNVINFCANNYLGLSSHPATIKGAEDALHLSLIHI
jgi:glycine C-acetyltransferase